MLIWLGVAGDRNGEIRPDPGFCVPGAALVCRAHGHRLIPKRVLFWKIQGERRGFRISEDATSVDHASLL